MKPLIDEAQIRQQVEELGQKISQEYVGKPLTVLGVLTGSIVLVSDLIRNIKVPLQVGFVEASSYRGKTTVASELKINLDSLPDLCGRDVLLVDDIFDTGRTLSALHLAIAERGPSSVKSAALLWKIGRLAVDYQPDFHCFQIPDEFVVGYGLDYNDDYRHLPFIGVLEDGDIDKS